MFFTKVPDPLLTISVDREGKVYYSLSSTTLKVESLRNMIERYGDKYPALRTLNEEQINKFASVEMLGADINQLSQLLSLPGDQINNVDDLPGIPVDSLNNQLGDWVMAGRYAEPSMRIAIKGDKTSKIATVREVIKTLTDKDIHTFNLITMLEVTPGAGDVEQ